MSDAGLDFARALADKDATTLGALLAPAVEFKGLTPRRFWEGHSPDEVVSVLFGSWFEPQDEIRSLISSQTGHVQDRDSVTYRLHVTNPDGDFEVEQTAYLVVVDGQISDLRIMCSGFIPMA